MGSPTAFLTLSTDDAIPQTIHGMFVRRLTPTECARLQGFPDDYLDIAYRGKPAADGPKYKALGNSMAVPVVRWIGERLQAVKRLQVPDFSDVLIPLPGITHPRTPDHD